MILQSVVHSNGGKGLGLAKSIPAYGLLLWGLLLPVSGLGRDHPVLPPSGAAPDAVETLAQMFAPRLAGTKSESPRRRRCGVEITDLVAANWHLLAPELRAAIPDDFRPLEFRIHPAKSNTDLEVCDAYLDSEHFRVHYSTDPVHQPPGYPDLQTVRDLADHLETAYVYHRDVSGMGIALTDGENGGGSDLYDCYFFDFDPDLFGQMRGMGRVDTGCGFSMWGIILVATDLWPLDLKTQMALTSEHEYYHLLQYAHNADQYSWIKESTARFSEFQVWPEIAMPRGVGSWMQTPFLPLWSTVGLREYAPHMWFYLEAHFGRDFVTRMWRNTCHSRAEDYLVDELEAQGTTWDAMLTDFALWNYFSGWRDDGHHYDPALNVPAVHYQAAHGTFPVPEHALLPGQIAQPTGSNYIRFNGPPQASGLHIAVSGDPALSAYRVITFLAVNQWGHQAWTLIPDSEGDSQFTVPDWGRYEHVALVVTNLSGAPADSAQLYFTYSAEAVPLDAPVGDHARLVAGMPNPFSELTQLVYYVPQDDTTVMIRIFDLRGRLVRSLTNGAEFAGNHQTVWLGRDQNGQPVASGVYFVQLDSGSYRDVRKVLYVR